MGKIILSTMCAIFDEEKKRALFINRKKRWKGIAFPGGHLEPNESIIECVVREVKEETNLDISNIKSKGITHFFNPQINERHIIFNFTTDTFSGELNEHCEEGELIWVGYDNISNLDFAEGMELRLDLFFDKDISEFFVEWNECEGYKRTIKKSFKEKL